MSRDTTADIYVKNCTVKNLPVRNRLDEYTLYVYVHYYTQATVSLRELVIKYQINVSDIMYSKRPPFLANYSRSNISLPPISFYTNGNDAAVRESFDSWLCKER